MNKIKYILFAILFAFEAPVFAKKKESPCDRALAQAQIAIRFQSDPLRLKAAQVLANYSRAHGGNLSVQEVLNQFGVPPKPDMGQIAFPAFPFAKILKAPPAKIASELAEALRVADIPMVTRIETAGPYVNFSIDSQAYLNWMLEAQESGRFFASDLKEEEREKISIEFSQPNTHKALHVGHMRNMFLGESVAKLLEFGGHKVERSTYPGDMGTHVAKALWYIRTHKANEVPHEPSAEWLGRMYAEADQYVKSNSENPDVKAGIEIMLKNLESRHGDDYDFYLKTREWSLDQMRAVYDWLGIKFDQWYCESECDEPSRELVLKKLKEGVLVQDDGAVGLDLKNENLGFVLMLKKDGSGLYLTKDLELLRQKFDRSEATRSIVVVDARQQLHFRQVFRAAEIMGIANASQSRHLSYETVNDREGKAFSSRALVGGLNLWQLKQELEKSPDPRSALNNLRWGFLRVAPGDQIRFDMEEWMRKNGSSASELTELAKALSQVKSSPRGLTPHEESLVLQISAFQTAAAKAIRELDPSEVARYLSDLKLNLEKWQKETPELHPQVARAAALVIGRGLELLTIKI